LSYLVLLDRLQPYNKKRPRVCTRSPFKSNLKVSQEQQTQLHDIMNSGLSLTISTGGSTAHQPRNKSNPKGSGTRKFKIAQSVRHPPGIRLCLAMLEELDLAQTLLGLFQSFVGSA
jgi:hypothetical protein